MKAKVKRAIKLLHQLQDADVLSFETVDFYINQLRNYKSKKSVS